MRTRDICNRKVYKNKVLWPGYNQTYHSTKSLVDRASTNSHFGFAQCCRIVETIHFFIKFQIITGSSCKKCTIWAIFNKATTEPQFKPYSNPYFKSLSLKLWSRELISRVEYWNKELIKGPYILNSRGRQFNRVGVWNLGMFG